MPLGSYSLSNLKRKLLTLLASLANLSITIAIKTLGFDLEKLVFVPFARNDPQRNSHSPSQHEKWKAFRRPPQNNVLSKFQKWIPSRQSERLQKTLISLPKKLKASQIFIF